jgi:hypothetical protein
VGAASVEDPQLQLPGAEPSHLLEGGKMGHLALAARIALLQAAKEALDAGDREIGETAQPKRAHAAGPARLGDRAVEAPQQLTSLLGEDPSGLGHRHHPRGSLEQLHAQLPLEPAYRLGERRLGDVQAPGGAPEVQLLDHRKEVAEVPKLNGGRG